MRIAVSSSTFRRPLAAGELTQLEWLERCASELDADGVLADLTDFPRTDTEYTAQLRKVAVDLGIVPFGLDAAGLFERDAAAARERALAVATGFGALVVRSALPAPGDVPPASFVETVATVKGLGRAAKAANVTLIVPAAAGTLGDDLAAVKRLLKDADSAWVRPCPRATDDDVEPGPRHRFPALSVTPEDDPALVLPRAQRPWLILDAPAGERPWETVAAAIAALRDASAERRLGRGASA
ncbi:MAG TPA: hypothetical protein VHT05_11215 [Candidatus Elarobacter sp.]|jgi:hypothetical protein|nr:hypothetical protein [Candidatus Elarobacter sp.]